MTQKPAIIDTSAISSWIKLQRRGIDIFQLLPNIMPYVLIPEKIVAEIEAYSPELERPRDFQSFLGKVGSAETSFFRLCTTLDSIVLEELLQLPRVDGGEAEALAQSSKRKINWILIDDKKCLPELKKVFPDVHFHNSLILLAILAATKLLPEHEKVFDELNKVYNYNPKQKEDALRIANKWLENL